jgi:hypothetical protein
MIDIKTFFGNINNCEEEIDSICGGARGQL